MEKIEEIKNLIVQLENKLEELKNDISPEEVVIKKEQFGELELILSKHGNDYLKFGNFRFVCPNFSKTDITNDIVQDIKSGNLKSISLRKCNVKSINSIIVNSEIFDVSRVL